MFLKAFIFYHRNCRRKQVTSTKKHMKYISSNFIRFILFIILSQVSTQAFSQWNSVISPSTYRFQSVVFPSASIGFIGGAQGIFKTTDSGNSWSKIYYSTPDSLYLEGINEHYLHFISNTIGIAVGWNIWDDAEIIIKTIDGGITWVVKQNGSAASGFRSLSFPSTSIGFAAGKGGRILKTVDSGDTWIPLTTGTTLDLFGICFIDNNNGFAVGNNVIIKTSDGGSSWNIINTSDLFTSVYFTSISAGYAGTVYGSVYKTSDGGVTWVNTYLGENDPVNKLFFVNDSVGYISVGGTGEIYKTSSYGTYWEPQPSSYTPSPLLDVIFTTSTNGFSVGESGVIKRTFDGGGSTAPVSWFTKNTTLFCADSIIHFVNHGNPANLYSWLVNGNIVSNAYNYNLLLNPSTNYTVSLIANNGTLSDTSKSVFTSQSSLNFTLNTQTVNDSLCTGNSTIIKVLSSVTGVIYKLKNGTTTIGSSQNGNGGTLNFNTGVLSSTVTLTLEATKSSYCGTNVITTSHEINVFQYPNTGLTLAAVKNPICKGDTATIILHLSEPGVTYQLKKGTQNIGLPQIGNGGDLSFLNDTLQIAKTYSIKATNFLGCTSTFSNSITINIRSLTVGFTLPSYGTYANDTLNIGNTSNADTYFWQLNGASINNSTSFVPQNVTYPNTGSYSAKLIGQTIEGCIDSVTKNINVFNHANALTGTYCWKNNPYVDSSNQITILAQHIDKQGNIYLTGYKFGGTISYPYKYFFVLMKLDKYGNLLWKKLSSQASYNHRVFGSAVATDSLGNIYVGGTQNCPNIKINGQLIPTNNSSNNSTRMMILKFNGNGDFLWGIFDNSGSYPSKSACSDILIDNKNNIYLSIVGRSALKFTDNSVIQVINNVDEIAVLKINSDGKYINHIVGSGTNFNHNPAISCFLTPAEESSSIINESYCLSPKIKMSSTGKIIVEGVFSNYNLNFGGHLVTISQGIGYNGFIAVYDTSGSWVSAFNTFQSSAVCVIPNLSFDLDNSNNIYITGQWDHESGSCYDFNIQTGNTNPVKFILANDTLTDKNSAFLIKYDINGNHLWHTLFKIYSFFTRPSVQGFVVGNNNHPYILTGMKNYLNYNNSTINSCEFYSVSGIPPVGFINNGIGKIMITEYDENGDVVGADSYADSGRVELGVGKFDWGLLSKNNCGDIYYSNVTRAITIGSDHFSNPFDQIVLTKYVTDNQCEKLNCATVNSASISATSNSDVCTGEQITINWQSALINTINILYSNDGGIIYNTLASNYNSNNPPYIWYNPPSAGNYTIIVHDTSNNSVADTLHNVIIHPIPILTVSNDTSICLGQSVALTALTSGTGNTYIWTPGNLSGSMVTITPTIETTITYSVSVTTQYGCNNSDSIKVTSLATPSTTIEHNSVTSLFSNTQSPDFIYQWNFNNIPIPGASTENYIATQTGNYSLTITWVPSGCAFTTPVEYISVTGIENITINQQFLIINNNEDITIVLKGKGKVFLQNFYLSDITGKIILHENNILLSEGEKKQVPIKTLPSGVYILTILNGENSFKSKILITR